jgi:hypothetical protein
MLVATNKRLLISKSRSYTNRCTPYKGKPDRYDTYASHVSPYMPLIRFLQAVPVHGNHSRGPNRVGQMHCSQEKVVWLHLSAQLSGPRDSPQFLSQHNHWSNALKPSICWWTSYIDLLGPYLQHAISIFNTCSRGPTHQSLTDTGGGYNLEGVGFPHHSPRPS